MNINIFKNGSVKNDFLNFLLNFFTVYVDIFYLKEHKYLCKSYFCTLEASFIL